MAVKELTIVERDYLRDYTLFCHEAYGDQDKDQGEARPFAMVRGADLQLTRRVCEADLYIPASSHESDHIRLGQVEEIRWMRLFLSQDQEVDDDEAAMLPLQEQLGQFGRLNYQRHRQGKLSQLVNECAMCPDRLVFHQRYKDFRVAERGR
eukprot:7304753-Alexandrium_andersonii.AAC.1